MQNFISKRPRGLDGRLSTTAVKWIDQPYSETRLTVAPALII